MNYKNLKDLGDENDETYDDFDDDENILKERHQFHFASDYDPYASATSFHNEPLLSDTCSSFDYREGILPGSGSSEPSKSSKSKRDSFDLNNFNERSFVETEISVQEEESIAYFTFLHLVESLCIYGAPINNVVGYSENLAKALMLSNVYVRMEPAGFWVKSKNKHEYFHVLKSVNINKLGQVVSLIRSVCGGTATCSEILEKVEEIHLAKNCYPSFIRLLAFPIYALGFTVFFYDGDWKAIVIAALIGILNGLHDLFTTRGYFKNWSKVQLFIITIVPGLATNGLVYFGLLEYKCGFAASLGTMAFYFPGVNLSFSVMEMLANYLSVGCLKYVYAQFMAHVIAGGLALGHSFWFDYFGPEKIVDESPCTGTIGDSIVLRILFFLPLYISSIIMYEVPLSLTIPFFVVQALSYTVLRLMQKLTSFGPYVATATSVFVMVILASFFSHRFIRKLFPLMFPMALIIPALELLVPGATMIKMALTVGHSLSAEYSLSLIYTALSIAIGFYLAEAILKDIVKRFIPGIKGVLSIPAYKGPFNNFNPKEAFNYDTLQKLNPVKCREFLIIVIHSGRNLIGRDFGEFYNPYVRLCNHEEVEARSSIVKKTTNPNFDEAFVVPIITDIDGTMNFSLEVMGLEVIAKDESLGHLDCRIDVETQSLVINDKVACELADLSNRRFVRKRFSLADASRGELDLSFSLNCIYEQDFLFEVQDGNNNNYNRINNNNSNNNNNNNDNDKFEYISDDDVSVNRRVSVSHSIPAARLNDQFLKRQHSSFASNLSSSLRFN